MKSLFMFLFILGSSGISAYQTEEHWYPGKVKLKGGTELMGDINYDMGYQLARVRINGQITTLPEKQLSSMVIFTEKLWHEFQHLAYKNEQGEAFSTFAKVIYRSREKYSLYKEYFAVTEDFNINPMTGVQTIKEQPAKRSNDAFMPNPKFGTSMDSRLFLVDSEGNSQSISSSGFSKAYGKCFNKIKNFVTRNRLTIRNEAHVVRIIRYADYLGNGCSDD